jgi:hypothetical protein
MIPSRKSSTLAAVCWWRSRVCCTTCGTSAAVVSASRLPSASPTIALSTRRSIRFPDPAQGENPRAPPRAWWRLGLDDASDSSSSRYRCSLRPRVLIQGIIRFIPIQPWIARACGAPGSCAGHSRSPSRERARLPTTDRHACIKQQGRGAAPCGSWDGLSKAAQTALPDRLGYAVLLTHHTPHPAHKEESSPENRPFCRDCSFLIPIMPPFSERMSLGKGVVIL